MCEAAEFIYCYHLSILRTLARHLRWSVLRFSCREGCEQRSQNIYTRVREHRSRYPTKTQAGMTSKYYQLFNELQGC